MKITRTGRPSDSVTHEGWGGKAGDTSTNIIRGRKIQKVTSGLIEVTKPREGRKF